MASVLQAPEDTWSFQPLEGAHFQRSFQRIESAPTVSTTTDTTEEPERLRDEGISLDAMVPNVPTDQWTKNTQKDHPEICIPTNPGTLLHPGSCTPCAFVFRVAEGQVRNRCTNGDECGWCHHPSHPRTRGRRQKNGASARQKEAAQQQDMWTDKNGGNGSETSTRDTGSDSEKNQKNHGWSEGEDHKINRSTKDDRGSTKSSRTARDDRAKTNRQQRNGRDDRSKNLRMPDYYAPEKVGPERCNTPEFDEQYACYPRPQQPQALTGVMQENCYAQPTQILYSCVPVNVAVPAPAAEGMPEWTGYSPTAPPYMHDWNTGYPPEVRSYAPQGYMMLPMHQPQPQHWAATGDVAMRMANDGGHRSPERSYDRA